MTQVASHFKTSQLSHIIIPDVGAWEGLEREGQLTKLRPPQQTITNLEAYTTEIYLSQFWRLEVWTEVLTGFLSPETSPLALRGPFLVGSSHGLSSVHVPLLSLPLLIRALVLLVQGPTLGPHLILIISIKALSLCTWYWGSGLQPMGLGGTVKFINWLSVCTTYG